MFVMFYFSLHSPLHFARQCTAIHFWINLMSMSTLILYVSRCKAQIRGSHSLPESLNRKIYISFWRLLDWFCSISILQRLQCNSERRCLTHTLTHFSYWKRIFCTTKIVYLKIFLLLIYWTAIFRNLSNLPNK